MRKASAMKRKLAKKLASLAVAALFLLPGYGSEANAASHTRPGADFSNAYNASAGTGTTAR